MCAVAWSVLDPSRVATASDDSCVRVWKLQTGPLLPREAQQLQLGGGLQLGTPVTPLLVGPQEGAVARGDATAAAPDTALASFLRHEAACGVAAPQAAGASGLLSPAQPTPWERQAPGAAATAAAAHTYPTPLPIHRALMASSSPEPAAPVSLEGDNGAAPMQLLEGGGTAPEPEAVHSPPPAAAPSKSPPGSGASRSSDRQPSPSLSFLPGAAVNARPYQSAVSPLMSMLRGTGRPHSALNLAATAATKQQLLFGGRGAGAASGAAMLVRQQGGASPPVPSVPPEAPRPCQPGGKLGPPSEGKTHGAAMGGGSDPPAPFGSVAGVDEFDHDDKENIEPGQEDSAAVRALVFPSGQVGGSAEELRLQVAPMMDLEEAAGLEGVRPPPTTVVALPDSIALLMVVGIDPAAAAAAAKLDPDAPNVLEAGEEEARVAADTSGGETSGAELRAAETETEAGVEEELEGEAAAGLGGAAEAAGAGCWDVDSLVPCTYPDEDSRPASECASSPLVSEPQGRRHGWQSEGRPSKKSRYNAEAGGVMGDSDGLAAGSAQKGHCQLSTYLDAASRCAWEPGVTAAGRQPDDDMSYDSEDYEEDEEEDEGDERGADEEELGPGIRLMRGHCQLPAQRVPPPSSRAPLPKHHPLLKSLEAAKAKAGLKGARKKRAAAPAAQERAPAAAAAHVSPSPRKEQAAGKGKQRTLLQCWGGVGREE